LQELTTITTRATTVALLAHQLVLLLATNAAACLAIHLQHALGVTTHQHTATAAATHAAMVGMAFLLALTSFGGELAKKVSLWALKNLSTNPD
jgi:hypothetical protein